MKKNEDRNANKIPSMTRLKWYPRNRLERRMAERETKMMLRILMPIELEFNALVLKTEIDYDSLYHKYLDQWNAAIYRIRHREGNIVEPVADYFAVQFAPKETI